MYWEDDDVEALQRAAALEDREAVAAAARAANAKLRAPADAVAEIAAPSKTQQIPKSAPAIDRVAELEARVVSLAAERDTTETSLREARDETRRLRDTRALELADARAEAGETNARVKRAEADAAESAAAVSRLRRESSAASVSARETIDMLETEARRSAAVLKETAMARDNAEAKAVAVESEYAKREAALKAAHAEATHKLRNAVDKGRAEASTSETNAAEALDRLQTSNNRLEHLERRVVAATEETKRVKESLEAESAKNESLLRGVASRDARLAATETDLDALTVRLKKMTHERDEAMRELEGAKQALAEAKTMLVEKTHSSKTPSQKAKKVTNMSRSLRARDLNVEFNSTASPMTSPGKGKVRRFESAARKASVVAALGAGAWRAVKGNGGAPVAVPFGII